MSQHSDVRQDLTDDEKALFSYKDNPNAQHPDWGDTTPLCQACARGNDEAVHLLLLFGESVNSRNRASQRPLLLAAEQGAFAGWIN